MYAGKEKGQESTGHQGVPGKQKYVSGNQKRQLAKLRKIQATKDAECPKIGPPDIAMLRATKCVNPALSV